MYTANGNINLPPNIAHNVGKYHAKLYLIKGKNLRNPLTP